MYLILQVKLWNLKTEMNYLIIPHHVIELDKPIERIAFNPTNDSILAIAADNALILYDLMSQRTIVGMYVFGGFS